MGKEVGAGPEAAALNGADSGPGSVGSFLAQQRRLRGMSLDELASLTKIPRRSLDRLEAGVFDGAPDGFARGFVRTVAEALGLDPDEAVNRLLSEPREDEERLRAAARRDHRQLWLWGGALIAAFSALLILWRVAGSGEPDAEPSDDPVVYRHDAVRALAGERAHAPAPVPGLAASPEPAPDPAAGTLAAPEAAAVPETLPVPETLAVPEPSPVLEPSPVPEPEPAAR